MPEYIFFKKCRIIKIKLTLKKTRVLHQGRTLELFEEQPCISLNKSLNVDMWESKS